jgi:hypothetical protein
MMGEYAKLNFAEKLLLLAYIEDKGRISYRASGTIQYAFTAVSLLELCMRKKLRIEGRKVIVLDMSPMGDQILDEMLAKISDKYDPKSANYWTTALSHGLHKKIQNTLLDKGVFWEDYVNTMIIFTKKCYRLSDSRDIKLLHNKVRDVLLSEKEKFSSEDIIIAAMLKSSGILPLHLNKDEMKKCKDRLKSFIKDEGLQEKVMGGELAEAYKAVNRALTEVKAATSGA